MSNDKMRVLLDVLLKRTKAETIEWKEHPFEDAYFTNMSSATIFVMSRRGVETLEVRRASETVVDFISYDTSTNPYSVNTSLKALFDLAKRQALGTDKILDSIISELDEDVPF